MVPEPALNAIAYAGGQYVPLAEARVPVLDRGFLFGDGVYEVLPAYQGRPFALKEHLARLARSLRELQIANPHTDAQWADYVFARTNPKGRHAERWSHSAGCRRWFNVVRDTVTHEIGEASPCGLASLGAIAQRAILPGEAV